MNNLLFLLMLPLLFMAFPAYGADDNIINMPRGMTPAAPAWAPGAIIVLPDGQRAIIEEALPQGQLRTDLGIVLDPSGVIVEGPGKGGKAVLLVPENARPTPETIKPDAPDTSAPQAVKPEAALQIPMTPKKPEASLKAPVAPAQPKQRQEAPVVIQQPQAPAAPGQPDRRYTIAELMPVTTVPEKPEAKQEAPKKPEVKKPEKKPEPKPEKKPEPKHEPKPEKKPTPHKAKPGEELRIPPESAKSGNLNFLEGCWQGTRPEYYSKRTIRECFCFGAGGKNGKRRIYDSQGGRQCIGSASARLSGGGVLSVTSSSAVCNDGERWGQAEMVCRNSGPKTPCSWVFRDAQNGRQSYQIPFVRVESCGR